MEEPSTARSKLRRALRRGSKRSASAWVNCKVIEDRDTNR